MRRTTIRKTLQSLGRDTFIKLSAVDRDLGNIAGEFIRLNEEYVLNHQNLDETYKTIDILQNGFAENQLMFLDRLKQRLEDPDAE